MECPHLNTIAKINNPFIKEGLVLTSFECSVCRTCTNTWMCVHCGIVNCGRYANGHAIQHFQHQKHHHISIDCNELTIFCYICNDFVINEKCYKHFKKLQQILIDNRAKLGFIQKRINQINNTSAKDSKSTFNKKQFRKKVNNSLAKKNNKKIICKFKASGLRNLGNTCFMNAVLQSLCYCFTYLPAFENSFRNTLNNNKSFNDENETLVSKELRKTMTLLLEGSKSVNPQPLFSVIWKIVPRFRFGQQDAHEFLRYMLDRLHTELAALSARNQPIASKNNLSTLKASIVTSVFGGILQSEVRCLICRTESKKHDQFFDLSLDIPQKYCQDDSSKQTCLLSECITKFTEVEELADTELYCCPTCKKKQKSTKKFWIRRLPNILCLHIKRFKWNDYIRSKLDVHVQFPTTNLDMSSFLLSNMHETRNNGGSPIYDLAAVIVHHGNGLHGHYTSFASHNGCWHHFNDSSVTVCNEEAVLKSKAYILFYIRRQ